MEPRSRTSRSKPRARSSMEWWFEALDHRRVGLGGRSRVALVTGIHADGADLWIQVTALGEPFRSIVLHVSRRTTVYDAVAALREAWSDGPPDKSVIHLAPAA